MILFRCLASIFCCGWKPPSSKPSSARHREISLATLQQAAPSARIKSAQNNLKQPPLNASITQRNPRIGNAPLKQRKLSQYHAGGGLYNRMMPSNNLNTLNNSELNLLRLGRESNERGYETLETTELVTFYNKINKISPDLLLPELYKANDIILVKESVDPLRQYVIDRLEIELRSMLFNFLNESLQSNNNFSQKYDELMEQAKTCYAQLSKIYNLGPRYETSHVKTKEHYLLVVRSLGDLTHDDPSLEANQTIKRFLGKLEFDELKKFVSVCPPPGLGSNPTSREFKRNSVANLVRDEFSKRSAS